MMDDDRDKLRTITVRPDSLSVNNGNTVQCIGLSCPADNPSDFGPKRFLLWDNREGRDGTRITVNGIPVCRWPLFRWFSATKGITAEVVIDFDRYGHVVEVRFLSPDGSVPEN